MLYNTRDGLNGRDEYKLHNLDLTDMIFTNGAADRELSSKKVTSNFSGLHLSVLDWVSSTNK